MNIIKIIVSIKFLRAFPYLQDLLLIITEKESPCPFQFKEVWDFLLYPNETADMP